MKKLKKIILINWLYFSKEIIEFDDINFLTGKNGSGKSTIIDALQIVLLGEINQSNFNKAANEKSKRTLDGYLRADMDTENPNSRKGKDFSSYIACEFYDDIKLSSFVAGIVFDCRNDGSYTHRYYIYGGKINEDCFMKDNQAKDIPSFRAFLKQNYGINCEIFDSNISYRNSLNSKWNVHNEHVFLMLKKAVSFKPITDIQKFITENICDISNKLDIEEMQQNIRDYKLHEKKAYEQQEKIDALENIAAIYKKMNSALDNMKIHRFLTLWGESEDLKQKIEKCEIELNDTIEQLKNVNKEIETTKQNIVDKNNKRDLLYSERNNNDIYQKKILLEKDIKALKEAIADIESKLNRKVNDIKMEATYVCNACEDFKNFTNIINLKEIDNITYDILRSFTPLKQFTYDEFQICDELFKNICEKLKLLKKLIEERNIELKNESNSLKTELSKNNESIGNLKKGKKDYPKELISFKNKLVNELRKNNKFSNTNVWILADLLEIKSGEEIWRSAVEGYLGTQKFYILTEPDAYGTALNIYNHIKNDYESSFGLVDISKLREGEVIKSKSGSLAEKIETNNSFARSYIDYLLGRVICCNSVNELRQYKISITSEGMLYQGYVARRLQRKSMNDCYIGKKAIEYRIDILNKRQSEINDRLNSINPIISVFDKITNHEMLFCDRYLSGEFLDLKSDYHGLLIKRSKIKNAQEEFDGLDLFALQNIEEEIKKIENEINTKQGKYDKLVRKSSALEVEKGQYEKYKLPELSQAQIEKLDEIEEHPYFNGNFIQEIGLPRYKQELERLRLPSKIIKNFGDSFNQAQSNFNKAQMELISARKDFTLKYAPCSYRTDSMDNSEYENELKKLKENELPKYLDKIRLAKESAMEQFQNDFLAKLKSSIDEVYAKVKDLNRAIDKSQFDTDRYRFKIEKNPDYTDYYDMIMDPALVEGDGGLFALAFQEKYGELIKELFDKIVSSDDTQLNARKQSELQKNIEIYTDFRTYLKFDLETTDKNGNKELLSQTLNQKSGGETQTPFYIAVLASFAQIYRINDMTSAGNTVRLVVFDEAFNKMDSNRIIESIRLLRKMHLQAIVCTPPEKLPDIMPEADKTILVHKDNYKMCTIPWKKEFN